MFTTDSFLSAEIAYRQDKIRKDYGARRWSRARAASTRPRSDPHRDRPRVVGAAGHNVLRAGAADHRSHRTRCRAGGTHLPARHSRVRGSPDGPRDAPRRRRGRGQDTRPDGPARRRDRRPTGRSSPATASTWPTARCPTSPSPRSSAASWPTSPTSPRACSSSTPRSPASSPAGASAAARPRRATRPSTAATSTTRSATSSPPSPDRRPSSWSSRTPTGPTSPPATCSASSSPAPFPASRWSCPIAPTTSTDATRFAVRWPSGCGCVASTGSSSTRSPTTTYAASSVRSTPPPCPRRNTSPSSTGPRATRSSSRSWWARRGRDRSPASSPTSCWSTSTASTSPLVGWSASSRWPGAR